MDGIDASLLFTDGESELKEVASFSFDYAEETKLLLKSAERAIYKAYGDLDLARKIYLDEFKNYLETELLFSTKDVQVKLSFLKDYLIRTIGYVDGVCLDAIILLSTILHADVVKSLLKITKHKPSNIDVIGYHGQTMYHNPSLGVSVQVGDGTLLAKVTQIKVINNFRERDLNLGGQGAPFAPIFHQALAMRDAKFPLVFANCGGIANLSIVRNDNFSYLQGFDTGPGNGLVDAFIKKRTKNVETMDFNGKYGTKGKVCFKTTQALFEKSAFTNGENFYTKLPPKSLDIRDLTLVAELDKLNIEDGAATLENFTAEAIVSSLALLDNLPEFWVLAGGGFNNPVITNALQVKLNNFYKKSIKIVTATTLGWNAKSLEAQIFAYLAVRSLKNLPLSFPSTTGVAYPISGGKQHMVPLE